MMFRSRLLPWLVFTLSVLVFAQAPTGSISGVVQDSAEAVIAGAKVSVENTQTGLSRAGIAGALGGFLFSALPPGEYRVTAGAPGFKDSAATVQIFVGRQLTVNFTLEVAGGRQIE